ncbi:MAG: response regulator [Anaerolineae bacterium]|nr:response regulator [Anaerolineae bacterium]MDW8100901.1 response regulator [Anaerolineae bacterium]
MTREEFLLHLRDALNHLYDPERLRRNPLAALFGVAHRFDTASALQRILTDAIQSLKPPPGEPPQSPAWQIYEPLFYRYVEQWSAEEVADQLGITTRHLRRWQHIAQEALADLLWRQFGLADKLRAEAGEVSNIEQPRPDPASLRQELTWLQEASGTSFSDLSQVLPPVLDLVQKLAERHRVRLDSVLAEGLPRASIPPVALRQILISLFSVVIPRAAGGQVSFSIRPLRWDVEARIRCPQYPAGPQPPLDDEATNLNMAGQLSELCGCSLALSADARGFDAVLTIPALEQIPVLAIDDSADTLQLLQRYTTATRYRLIGTRDPEQGLHLAEQIAPQIIVLDVMMPHVDGWEVLGRLRQHPLTSQIPIVVCTILAQRELALLLGASDFVRKPVTRAEFLRALDRQIGRTEPGPG